MFRRRCAIPVCQLVEIHYCLELREEAPFSIPLGGVHSTLPEVVAFAGYGGVVIGVGPPEVAPPDRSTVLLQMLAPRHTMPRIPVSRAAGGRAPGCHVALKVWLTIVDVAGIGAMHSLWVMMVVPASRR